MRKNLILLSITILCLMVLYACGQEKTDYDLYIHQDVINVPSVAIENVFLPSSVEVEGIVFDITWTSSHEDSLSALGVVHRPSFEQGDLDVTLTATFSYKDFTKQLTYSITVRAMTITTYSISFLNMNETLFLHMNADQDTKISKPFSIPFQTGYIFKEWRTLDGELWDFDNDLVNSDLTFIAVFTPIPYTITYRIPDDAHLSTSGDDTYTIETSPKLKTATLDNLDFLGWYTEQDGGHKVDSIPVGTTGNLTLYARFNQEEVIEIPTGTLLYTKEDVVNFIVNGGLGQVHLMNDIDMTGVTLTDSSFVFNGVFDGRGHTIRGAEIFASGNKMGFLFKEVANGGVVKNVTFADSIHHGGGTSEASAFISAFAQGGSRFENITFYNVSVIHNGAYAALLFGDVINDASETTITIRNITVINDENYWIEGSSYVGGLIGAARKSVTIDIEHVYFDSKVLAPSQAVGAIMGRLNASGITLNVRQAVIKGCIESAKNVGSVLGTNVSGSHVNADMIFISDLIQISGTQTNRIGVGNLPSGSTSTLTNLYYHQNSTVFKVGTQTIAVPEGVSLTQQTLTQAWFDSSGFNPSFFQYVEGQIVRQIDQSIPVVETGFTLSTAQVKKYYFIGEELDLTHLAVYQTFSNGSSVLLDPSLYEIDHTHYDKNVSGTYEISIIYKDQTKSFTVRVVSVTHIFADDLLMKQTYLVGQNLNTEGLVVKAMLDDGGYIKLNPSDYSLNTADINFSIPGTYTLHIVYPSFEDALITIHVHDADLIKPNTVYIMVDHEHKGIDGDIVLSKPTFKTVKSALQYLINQNYTQDTIKIIYISSGIYREKLNITLPNTLLIGEDQEHTVITYDAASGTEQPSGVTWGTQGSATISIKSSATGFMAKNLTFQNDFDYINSTISDRQAVALVNEPDQVIFYQVSFKGYQDTLYAKSGRQYYLNVYIEGVVDFIFGNGGPAFFENSTIHSLARSTGVISTQKGYNTSSSALITYGFVFYQNTFTYENGVPAGSVDLGRPWDQQAAIAYIQNTFDIHISSRGWTEMSGNLPQHARFYEFENRDVQLNVLPTTTIGQTLTAQQVLLYADKDVVFGVNNGQVTFSSEWLYQQALTYLMTQSFE